MEPNLDQPAGTPALTKREAMTEYLRAEVARLQPGEVLPALNTLMDRFDCRGVQTARTAYKPLIREGLVVMGLHRSVRRFIVADPTNLAPAAYEGPTVRDFAAMLREAGELLTRAAAALDVVADAGQLGNGPALPIPPNKAKKPARARTNPAKTRTTNQTT